MKESIKTITSRFLSKSGYLFLKNLRDGLRSHAKGAAFIGKVVLPLLLRDRARPVLISRYVGMGDIVCTVPAVMQLKKRHPKSTFIYSCYAPFQCLPKMAGIASITTPLRADVFKAIWSFLFAGIYAFEFSDEKENSANSETVIADFCRQQGVAVSDAHPRLEIAPTTLSKAKRLLGEVITAGKPIIAIHCGPSWPIREWPRESWISLLEQLKRHGFTNIVQLGVGAHSCIGKVQGVTLPNVFSLVDKLSLEESVALISLCDLLVGIDSGLLHIAACVQTPALGLFGPTSPKYRFSKKSTCSFVTSNKECQGCHHRIPRLHWDDFNGCPYDIACMREIRVEDVLQNCLSRLLPCPA